jgi:DnaJ family protein A protein 2
LDVFVEKGTKNGHKIIFNAEGDQGPDVVPGDVVFVVQQKDHPVFRRDGDDLYIERTILLAEALCGFQFTVTHLDGRVLLVQSQQQQVVRPGK